MVSIMILPLLAIPVLLAFSPESQAGYQCGYSDYASCSRYDEGYGYVIVNSSGGDYLFEFFRNTDELSEYLADADDGPVYNASLTDEQCSDMYAGSYSVSFPADAVDTSYVSAGACTLYSVPDSDTGADIDVCTFSGENDSTQSCYGDWDAISSGEVNTFDGSQYSGSAEVTESSGIEVSDEVPEYLTQTDDPSSCATGSMTAGGVSYCVDTSSVVVTDLSGNAFGSGSGDGSGDGDGDGSGDGDGETDGQCDPETDGECEGEATECLPGMSCYVPTDAQVEAKFFDYFPGSVDNTQVTEYDASDFELDGEYESGLTSGSCPAPVPVTLALGGNSHTFEITFEFFCQFALLIRGLVLASCSFLAANIIYRGVVTLV